MIRNCMRAFGSAGFALVVGAVAASAQTTGAIEVPPVPANLAVPAGQAVFYRGYAIGTQNYVCLPTPTGVAWKFVAPQATLFEGVNGALGQQLTTHFLSANPE